MRLAAFLYLSLSVVQIRISAQGLPYENLLHPRTGEWPMYNGDFTGRRFSPLTQINNRNAGELALAWSLPTQQSTIKSTPLEVNGILYFTAPDHVWAVDARTGRQIWHFERPANGDHVGQRGVAMYRNRLFFGTTDAHLICLDARNGEKLWDTVMADVAFDYYISAPPLVVNDKLMVGISGDGTDIQGFLSAVDPATGRVLWRWDSVPKPGQPGYDTWPDAQAASHGGGTTWVTGTYDPSLNLIYWGTSNPHPVFAGATRVGANLYTCSLVALNPDTGKMAWYYQLSQHDVHDWDANQTPVLIDGTFDGKPRKLVTQASKDGYYYLLDRVTGQHLVTAPFVETDWASGQDADGHPKPVPERQPQLQGALAMTGGTNWNAPSFDADTQLFYVQGHQGFEVSYLTAAADKGAEDHQGGATSNLWFEQLLVALDYRTGRERWRYSMPSAANGGLGVGTAGGILTTAGHVLITGDNAGNAVALDPETGRTLWHVQLGENVSGSPMTYEVEGKQYILIAAGTVVYAFALPGS